MSLESKMKKHEVAIYTAAYAAAAAGIPGAFIPALDVGAISTAWVGMLLAIASNSNRHLDRNTALKFATGLLAGSAAYLGGSKLFTFALNFIPGIGTVAAVGINSLLNFLYTFRLGRFIALQMEKSEFDTEDWASMIPEVTALVFAMPSIMEMQESMKDWNTHQQYKN